MLYLVCLHTFRIPTSYQKSTRIFSFLQLISFPELNINRPSKYCNDIGTVFDNRWFMLRHSITSNLIWMFIVLKWLFTGRYLHIYYNILLRGQTFTSSYKKFLDHFNKLLSEVYDITTVTDGHNCSQYFHSRKGAREHTSKQTTS